MSDQLKRVENAFRKLDAIEPRKASRDAAIRAAMEQFEKENLTTAQGSVADSRLTEQGNKSSINWRRLMNLVQPKMTYILGGGVSLAALALALNINLIAPDSFEVPTNEVAVNNTQAKTDEAAKPADLKDAPAVEAEVDTVARSEVKEEFRQDADQSLPATTSLAAAPTRQKALVEKKRSLHQFAGGLIANEAVSNRAVSGDVLVPQYQDQGRDKFSDITPNPVKVVKEDPVSTFSVDVDTASYSFVRSSLNRSVLPHKDAVRVEEMINYFDYDYQAPATRAEPFKANVSIMPTPWNSETKLLRIGIKGFELPKIDAPQANLVFLIDTSGSMNAPDKLPLLRNSFKLLLSSLKPDDTVSIVTYAGSAGTVLEPTKVADKAKILSSLDRLSSGGSTAGAEGIRQAYQLAERNAEEGGVNRVILATDGDFNVGITDVEELKSFVERKRKSGVTLSVLGFGHGNYNDELMQTLAQNGNGNAAYIDTLSEARKVLVEEAGSTLFTIAKDVKLQLEFNPAMVGEYRLIGYETRLLNREDFNNDKIDAGDIGAGHSVTALYEMTLAGSAGRLVDDLRYQDEDTALAGDSSGEYAFMKIRYKLPDSDTSTLISAPVTRADEVKSVSGAPQDARFAAAVAGFGQILRGGRYTGDYSHSDVIALAQSAKGEDQFGYRAEFINLVRLAKSAAALEPLDQ